MGQKKKGKNKNLRSNFGKFRTKKMEKIKAILQTNPEDKTAKKALANWLDCDFARKSRKDRKFHT